MSHALLLARYGCASPGDTRAPCRALTRAAPDAHPPRSLRSNSQARDVQRLAASPCGKAAFLYGIGAGVSVGAISFFLRRTPPFSPEKPIVPR